MIIAETGTVDQFDGAPHFADRQNHHGHAAVPSRPAAVLLQAFPSMTLTSITK